MGAWSADRRRLSGLGATRGLPVAVLARCFAIGLCGAAAVGLAVGFQDTEDSTVAPVRLGGALLTGAVAGLIGRGIWGWLAASAGATLAGLPFLQPLVPDPSLAVGWTIFSCLVLAPGYGFGRALMLVLGLPSLTPHGRSAALRVPLRRGLRVGVVLSGGVAMVAALTAGALAGPVGMALGGLVGLAGLGVSYGLYRLIDRLDRGESRPALIFTSFFGALGLGWFGVMVAAGAPVAWTVAESLVPSSFMALSPWLLVRIAREQPSHDSRPVA